MWSWDCREEELWADIYIECPKSVGKKLPGKGSRVGVRCQHDN